MICQESSRFKPIDYAQTGPKPHNRLKSLFLRSYNPLMRQLILLPLCCYLCEHYLEAVDEAYCKLLDTTTTPIAVCSKFALTKKFDKEVLHSKN